MAGLPRCSDAMTNPQVTAGDACFLDTNRARPFNSAHSPVWCALALAATDCREKQGCAPVTT